MRTILFLAFALLVAIVPLAQEKPSLEALKQIVNSDREDRFEQVARFVERSDSPEQRIAALGLMREALLAQYQLQQTYYQTLPRNEANAKIEALFKPLWSNSELSYLEPKIASDLARSLFVASKSERVQRIKQLSREAGEDLTIGDELTTLGSLGCGTYDHTQEYKLYWAVRRYRDEAIQALGQKVGWNGRIKLTEALADYGKGKTDPRLKEIYIRLSEDRNTLVRGAAIMALAEYPGEEAQAIAVRGLTSKAADTRAKSMWLATELKMKTLEAEALGLVDDDVRQVGVQALKYLGGLGTPTAKAKLIETLKNEYLLYYDLDAIRDSKCIEASPHLVKLLAAKDVKEAGTILRTLYSVDTLAGAEEIEKALKSDDEELIEAAIALVSENKLQNARASLNRLADHKNEYVRKAALSALEELDKSR